MRKEIPLILATSMLLGACKGVKPEEKSYVINERPKVMNPMPDIHIVPTTAFYPTPYLLKIEDKEIETEPKKIMAESCILPVETGDMEHGLQYLSYIMQGPRPLKDPATGNEHHHLGWDIHASEGTLVANMCDGKFIWSGRVPNGDGTLGNVVVVEYTYIENGKEETSIVRYAHMEDVITAYQNGDFIAKGEIIGKVGRSGGWSTFHLHVDQIYKDKWDYLMTREDVNGDLATMSGFYAEAEKWDVGMVIQYFKDIREFTFSRLQKPSNTSQ